MSLVPWRAPDDNYFDTWRNRDLVPYWRRPWRDDFALGLHPRDVFAPLAQEIWNFERQARELECQMRGRVTVYGPITSNNGFEVCLDVRQFRPNEITVKTVGNSIIVEGGHVEWLRGYNSRQFYRRYDLPPSFDAEFITSELSDDGFLTIRAPPPRPFRARSVSIKRV